MKKGQLIISVCITLILILSVVAISSCKSQTIEKKKPPKIKPKQEIPNVANVTIRDFAFNPQKVTISVGGKITWVNRDSIPHRINGEDFDSGILRTNKTYQRTFDTAGSYDYSCSIHPSMTGTIIVK